MMQNELKESEKKLVEKAFEMLDFSYCPYSSFHVGAALLSKTGKIYGGCNVENAAYGPSNCAERTAIFKAVSEGDREFDSICITGGMNGKVTDYCPPCGVCRQVMREFCEDDFKIYMVDAEGYEERTLAEILPFSFSAKKHMV